MGKGDRRTAKGKRFRKSFGNCRPKDKAKRKARLARKAAQVQAQAGQNVST